MQVTVRVVLVDQEAALGHCRSFSADFPVRAHPVGCMPRVF
jgi:hypothetical protein